MTREPLHAIDGGAALTEARLAAGLTVVELAQQAGLNRSTVSNIEACRRPAGPKAAGRIAKALGKPVAALFTVRARSRTAPAR